MLFDESPYMPPVNPIPGVTIDRCIISTQVLLQRYPDEFLPSKVESMMEFQWCLFVDEMKRVSSFIIVAMTVTA